MIHPDVENLIQAKSSLWAYRFSRGYIGRDDLIQEGRLVALMSECQELPYLATAIENRFKHLSYKNNNHYSVPFHLSVLHRKINKLAHQGYDIFQIARELNCSEDYILSVQTFSQRLPESIDVSDIDLLIDLHQEIGNLNDEELLILTCHLRGLDIKSIASIHGTTYENIRVRLDRIIEELRRNMCIDESGRARSLAVKPKRIPWYEALINV